MKHNRVVKLVLGVALILLIPLALTLRGGNIGDNGWHWTASDFVFAFVMLVGTGLVYQLIAQKSTSSAYHFGTGLAAIALFLLIWINSAVGIIGEGPINLLYFGVLLAGIIGAVISHLKAKGLARTLLVMAVVQMLVPVIALVIAKPELANEVAGIKGVFALNAFFALLFIASALLFRRASFINQN